MIILKNDNSDFIYLDVVTKYSKNYSSKLSQHPVDGSGVITDHVTKNNPKISLVGSITGADFNFSKPQLTSEDRSYIGIGQLLISTDIAREVEVSNDNNPTNLFPDVVGQFFSDSLPEVTNLSEGRSESYSEKALVNVLRSFYENKDKLTLYEFDLGSVVDTLEDVFITNLDVSEAFESGDAIKFNITLEKATFSYLLLSTIPEDVREDFQAKKAEEKKLGGQDAQDTEESPLGEYDNSSAYYKMYVEGNS